MGTTALRIASALAVFLASLEPAVATSLRLHDPIAAAAGELLKERSRPTVSTVFTTEDAGGEWLGSMPYGYSIDGTGRPEVADAPGRSGSESGAVGSAPLGKSHTDLALPDGASPGFLFFFGGLLALVVLAGRRTRGGKKVAPRVEPLQVETVDGTAEHAQEIRPKILSFPSTAYRDLGLRALAEDSSSKGAIH